MKIRKAVIKSIPENYYKKETDIHVQIIMEKLKKIPEDCQEQFLNNMIIQLKKKEKENFSMQ